MKKLITFLMMMIVSLSLVACTNSDDDLKLDLVAAKEAIMATTSNTFDYYKAANILEEKGDLGKDVIYEYEHNLVNYGINLENIMEDGSVAGFREFVFLFNETEGKYLFIAKAANENLKAEVKTNLVDKYKGSYMAEYAGYLVALNTQDSKASFDYMVENSYSKVMSNVIFVPKEEAEYSLGIPSEMIEDALIAIPVDYTQTSQIIVIKTKDNSEEDVKAIIEEYMNGLIAHWENYLPDQAELIKNRIETKLGDYLVYIISNNNESILNALKSCVK